MTLNADIAAGTCLSAERRRPHPQTRRPRATGNPGKSAAQASRNVISGNNKDGIQINANDHHVLGNFIGTDATGRQTPKWNAPSPPTKINGGLTASLNLVALVAMNMKDFLLLGACVGTVLVAGCVGTVDGRQQVGLPFVKDKIEGRYERPAMEVWAAAKEVLNYNGRVYSEDVLKSTIEATVNTRTVWVKVEEVEKKYTRVIVQTRTKGGAPDLELASEIDKQIALRLASGVPLPPPPQRSGNN